MEPKDVRDRLQDIRGDLSMARAAKLYNIPLRTWENWEGGVRIPPEYVLLMMEELKHLRER